MEMPTFKPGDMVVIYNKHNGIVRRVVTDENGAEWFYDVQKESGFRSIVAEKNIKAYATLDTQSDDPTDYISAEACRLNNI